MNQQNQIEPLPDWMVFIGKWGDAEQGHPLVYHLLDSAAVAQLLWEKGLTPGARTQISTWLNIPEQDCGRLLAFWTSLHDLGKATPTFQSKHAPTRSKLEQLGYRFPQGDICHHSLLSQWILNDFSAELNLQPLGIFNDFRFAIGGHHGVYHVSEDQENSLARRDNLGAENWQAARRALFMALQSLLCPPDVPQLQMNRTQRNAFFNLLTGFFVTADWISSQDDIFKYAEKQVSLPEYWQVTQKTAQDHMQANGWFSWQPTDAPLNFEHIFGFAAYPLQEIIVHTAQGMREPFLMIVEAPTGCGKTEAALMVAEQAIQSQGLRGAYVAMPTQATSNQMFTRTAAFLSKRYPALANINFQLIHGNALLNKSFLQMRLNSISDDDHKKEGNVNALEWFLPKKRSLLAPFGVGTVDQAFFSVLRTRHSFLRLFGLFRKVVIFDEVHAYDTYMMEIFKLLLPWLRALGTSVIILSATLPETTRRQLLQSYQYESADEIEPVAYPRLTYNDGKKRRSIALGSFPDRTIHLNKMDYSDTDKILKKLHSQLEQGGCAAVVCNTVDRAQAIYKAIKAANTVAAEDLYLLHARMPFCWRAAQEEQILARFGKQTQAHTAPRRGIVVATQIIEQSLDLDFDLLVSDLAPIDLLIQRIGRLHRHSGGVCAPVRPANLAQPTCIVCQPADPAKDALPEFANDCFVYDPAVLQRTYFTLSQRKELVLPADSDSLINTVYANTALDYCTEQQNELICALIRKMEEDQSKKIQAAQNRLIEDVDLKTIFNGRAQYLREDDQTVAQDTQAMTRYMIQPSVQLVCFHLRDGQTVLVDEDTPLDIHAVPDAEQIIHCIKSMVSVSKREVVKYYLAQPKNAAWKKISALRFAHAVVFVNGTAALADGVTLKLTQELGLEVVKDEQ